MQPSTVQALLALNRKFYDTVAAHFDATRQGWTPGQLAILPYFRSGTKQSRISVLDVGCGNGRFARLLAEQEISCDYTGVDGDASLLALAQEAVRPLPGITAHFHQADLADPDWAATLQASSFDVVICLATIQHLPGYAMRLRLFQDFRNLSQHWIIVSFWQFLTSPRFVERQIAWHEVELSAREVEPGDTLLPWKQGVHAIRYVHQVDQAELQQLAHDADLHIHDTFRADGKEGDLNLYGVLTPGQAHG